MVGAWNCVQGEQQPCAVQIAQTLYFVQETLLLINSCPNVCCHKIHMNQWRSQHFDTTFVCGGAASPYFLRHVFESWWAGPPCFAPETQFAEVSADACSCSHFLGDYVKGCFGAITDGHHITVIKECEKSSSSSLARAATNESC